MKLKLLKIEKNYNNKDLKISTIAYIGLGSNKGERLINLQKAVDNINSDVKCHVIDKSYVYETKAFGNIEQDNFLNAVISIDTEYPIKELFYNLKKTENRIGRTKSFKWGPREIDLDLLFYNEQIYSDSELIVPHPGMTERDFVIVPMCDIAPDFMHPVIKKIISEIDLTGLKKNIINRTEYKL